MEKEFNLSEKIQVRELRKGSKCHVLNPSDIKEFIKRIKDIKDKDGYYLFGREDAQWILRKIDKLAGSKLL